MEPGELGEPMQGKKLLALSSRKEPVLERGEDQEERCLVGNFTTCGEEESLVSMGPGL